MPSANAPSPPPQVPYVPLLLTATMMVHNLQAASAAALLAAEQPPARLQRMPPPPLAVRVGPAAHAAFVRQLRGQPYYLCSAVHATGVLLAHSADARARPLLSALLHGVFGDLGQPGDQQGLAELLARLCHLQLITLDAASAITSTLGNAASSSVSRSMGGSKQLAAWQPAHGPPRASPPKVSGATSSSAAAPSAAAGAHTRTVASPQRATKAPGAAAPNETTDARQSRRRVGAAEASAPRHT